MKSVVSVIVTAILALGFGPARAQDTGVDESAQPSGDQPQPVKPPLQAIPNSFSRSPLMATQETTTSVLEPVKAVAGGRWHSHFIL